MYLGFKFTYTGNIVNTDKVFQGQALRAYIYLSNVIDELYLDTIIKLSRFDLTIVPILTYVCEIWSVYYYKDVDKLHIRFCKYILGVKNQAPSFTVHCIT